jgi:hypothetical protein
MMTAARILAVIVILIFATTSLALFRHRDVTLVPYAIAVALASLLWVATILTGLLQPLRPNVRRVATALSYGWVLYGLGVLGYVFSGYGGAVPSPAVPLLSVILVYLLPGIFWMRALKRPIEQRDDG